MHLSRVLLAFTLGTAFFLGACASSSAPGPPPLSVVTSVLPLATENSIFSVQLEAAGGVAPYKWSVRSGSLPAGVTLSPAGVLSGTPQQVGTFSIVVSVQDSSTTVLLNLTLGKNKNT